MWHLTFWIKYVSCLSQGSVEFAVRTEQAAHQWKESLERVIANAKPSASASDPQDELGM
jgi:hypothetical protein